MDISIILNCHAEALLLHRTIAGIEKMRGLAHARQISTEVIVIADNITAETDRYLNTHHTFDYTIHRVQFKDPGLSRNYGIEQARGKYIALHDGDDIFSQSWLTKAYELSENMGSRVILHPEYSLTFGSGQQFIHHRFSQNQERFHHRSFFDYNPFDALAFAAKTIFTDNPYPPNGQGAGFEDWHWNLNTIAKGYQHFVVPETVLFIRRKNGFSILASHVSQEAMYDKTLFFDPLQYITLYEQIDGGKWWDRQKSLYSKRKKTSRFSSFFLWLARLLFILLSLMYKAGKKLKKKDRYYFSFRVDNFLRSLSGATKAFLSDSEQAPEIIFDNEPTPPWLLEEINRANKVEAELISDPVVVESFLHYQLPAISKASEAYYEICKLAGGYYEHIVLAPWLKTGGSDLVTINYINSLLQQEYTDKIFIILTENTPSEWLNKLDKRAVVLSLGERYSHLSKEQLQKILCRIILQFNCRHLHQINSKLGFDTIAKYGRLISKYTHIYPHAYCYVIDDQENYTGYVFREIGSVYPYVKYILTENEYIISFLTEKYGYDRAKFRCIYQPLKQIEEKAIPAAANKIRVMWAGRFDKQKRPHLLVKIAKRLYEIDRDIEIHVYGKKLLDTYFSEAEFNGMKNVILKGPYSNWGDLKAAEYDVFLYTSIYDGMPNVVLEALSSGMVVVAPRQGGLPEIIENGVNGFLVPNTEEVEPYVNAILSIKEHPDLKVSFYEITREKLLKQHSQDTFNHALSIFKDS